MTIISLKEFLKTGKFGNIEIGVSTKQDVIALMGEGYDFGDCGIIQIIKYGWYEFFYWTESQLVQGIQNDHLLFDCSNHQEMIHYENAQVKLDTWFLSANQHITFAEITTILEQEGIAYQLAKHRYEGALEHIQIESGVTIDFVDEKDHSTYDDSKEQWNFNRIPITHQKDYLLNGIRLFER